MTESFNTQLADRLLQMAMEKKMKVGDKFPNENELAEQLKVSRVSLREAINGLKFLGILDAAPRRGTTIAALDYGRLLKYISFQQVFSPLSEKELFDARMSIETGIMGLLIERMTEEDFQELLRLAVACRREDDTPEAIRNSIDGDMMFHRKLLEVTRNGMLQAFAKVIDCFFISLHTHYGTMEDTRSAAEIHVMIVEAIHEHNLGLAQGLMQKHLARHISAEADGTLLGEKR